MVNQLSFKKSDYVSEEDMYLMVVTQIKLLLQNNHVLTVFNDKKTDQVILKFAYVDPSKKIEEQNEKFPYWLFPEEANTVFELNKVAQVELFKQLLNKAETDLVDDSNIDDDDMNILPSKPSKNEA